MGSARNHHVAEHQPNAQLNETPDAEMGRMGQKDPWKTYWSMHAFPDITRKEYNRAPHDIAALGAT